ncbi:hypothetical protein GGI42DRAFT_68312 [Trichoderma sp. SZMC 28013]
MHTKKPTGRETSILMQPWEESKGFNSSSSCARAPWILRSTPSNNGIHPCSFCPQHKPRVPAWLRGFRSNLSAKVRQGTKRDASSGVASRPMTKTVLASALLKHIQQHVPGCWTLGVDMDMEIGRWIGTGLGCATRPAVGRIKRGVKVWREPAFWALSTFVPLTSLPGSKSKGPSQGGGVRGEAPQGKQALLWPRRNCRWAMSSMLYMAWLGIYECLQSAGRVGRTGILS